MDSQHTRLEVERLRAPTITERMIVAANGSALNSLAAADLSEAARRLTEAHHRLKHAREDVSYGTILAATINGCELALMREQWSRALAHLRRLDRLCRVVRERYLEAAAPLEFIRANHELGALEKIRMSTALYLSRSAQELGPQVHLAAARLLPLARHLYLALRQPWSAECPSAIGSPSPSELLERFEAQSREDSIPGSPKSGSSGTRAKRKAA